VFSAFAVEHALAELIWVRCWLQTPAPYRSITRKQAANARTIPAKVELVGAITKIDADILGEMKRLFEYRNRIAHATAEPLDNETLGFDALKAIQKAGRGDDLDEAIERALRDDSRPLEALAKDFGQPRISLVLSGLGTDDVFGAEENFRIAERAVEALTLELNSPDWPPSAR